MNVIGRPGYRPDGAGGLSSNAKRGAAAVALVTGKQNGRLGLRECVLLKQALQHQLPGPVAQELVRWAEGLPAERQVTLGDCAEALGRPIVDRKQCASPVPALEPAWPVGEAARTARAFLARHGIGEAPAVPQAQCYGVCRSVLLEAVGALVDENLSYVTEALTRQLGRAAAGGELQRKMLCAVIDRAGKLRPAQAVELLSGVLRAFAGDTGKADRAVSAMARRAFVGTFKTFQAHAREGSVYNIAGLRAVLGALAVAAGGSRMGPGRLEALLGVIDEMQRCAGSNPDQAFEPEQVALVFRDICDAAGGESMPAQLRLVATARVCSPAARYSPALRAALAKALLLALGRERPDAPVESLSESLRTMTLRALAQAVESVEPTESSGEQPALSLPALG